MPRFPILIIAGALYDKPYLNRISRFLRDAGIEGRVQFLGAVDEKRLRQLYSACRFFVFPSTVESFGIILVEALASGCAVACSNASVMPEICADAAVYFESTDPNSIARHLIELHQDESLRKSLQERAVRRAAEFSWRATAQQSLDFLRQVQSCGHLESVKLIPEMHHA